MTANDSQIPLDRFPDPACSYSFEDDGAVLRARNEQFTAVSDCSTGDPLTALFEELSVAGDRPSLDRTDRCWVRQPGADSGHRYLLRIIPPEDDQLGHLVFNTVASADAPQNVGVDRVASVISHDLRNPLDVARARLRAGRELDSAEHFDHVEQAHDRMERIIQDVLTLARGEDVVNPEQQVDLDVVLKTAWQTVETPDATLIVDEELPTAVADRDRVTRLFENLFRNAVEHGPTSPASQAQQDAVEHGSTSPDSNTRQDAGSNASEPSVADAPEDAVEHGSTSPDSNTRQDAVEHGPTGSDDGITITVGRLPDGLFVADDGVGIAPENRDRVFEPGFSSDDHGTGLGLAIVARIVDLHGWSVRVTDSETGGARFEITGIDSE